MNDPRKTNATHPHLAFELAPLARCIVAGAIAAAAALLAGYLVFGPFSDRSAVQLAAGPRGDQLGESHRAAVFLRTGRAWAAAELAAQEQAASAATTLRVARVATSHWRR